MSGIKANSTSKTMVDGDTAVDKAISGFIAKEQITLSVTGTPVSTVWSMAKPSAAGARSELSSTTDASPTFTPEVEGYYTVVCVVAGTTTYILRIAVADIGAVSTLSAIRLLPLANAQVPAPATGRTIYYSSDADAVVEKRPDGSVHPFTVT